MRRWQSKAVMRPSRSEDILRPIKPAMIIDGIPNKIETICCSKTVVKPRNEMTARSKVQTGGCPAVGSM